MTDRSGITVGGTHLDSTRGSLLVLVLGLAVAGYGGYDYVQQSDAVEHAVEIDATILETGVEADEVNRRGVDYHPTVRFEYTYEGESHTSSRVYPSTLGRTFDTESAAAEAIADYAVGETVTAYIDPADPDRAFLKRTSTPMGPLLVVGLGTLFALVGGGSLLGRVRNRG